MAPQRLFNTPLTDAAIRVHHRPPSTMPSLLALPEHLLVNIIRIAQPTDASSAFIIALSRVCQRLRLAALSAPDLWATIDSTLPAPLVAAHLARSRGAPLTIRVRLDARHAAGCAAFLRTAAPHAARWRKLCVLASDARPADGVPPSALQAAMAAAKRVLDALRLPALEKLVCELPEPVDADVDTDGGPSAADWCFDLNRGWIAPRLQGISVENATPCPALAATLTACKIKVSAYEEYQWPLAPLFTFLATSTRLKTLHIEFRRASFQLDHQTMDRLGFVRLPELETLTFYLIDCRYEEHVHFLMQHISTPNISKLSVCFTYYEEVDVDQWFSALLKINSEYPSLRSFSMANHLRSVKQNEEFPLDLLFRKMPNLQHLSIVSPYISLPKNLTNVSIPPLRSISLTNCKDLTTYFLKDLAAKLLQTSEQWTIFEKLTLSDCPNVKPTGFSGIFPEEKLEILSRPVYRS